MTMRRILLSTAIAVAGLWPAGNALADSAAAAQDILKATGVRGGLVVHLGCGDGRLTAALRAGDAYVVQGLSADPADVAASREHVRGLGLYGPVSIATWDDAARLPYADNLVNLVVAEEPGGLSEDELLRVLAPGGVAYVKGEGGWSKTVKPWPDDIDQWTHHLHDAGGNPVAQDRVAGPPRHLQWTAAPRWARSHGWSPSVSAMVSASGRVFCIVDETLTGIDGSVPDKWFLTARDAFSGVLLWKRPVPHWGSAELSGTPGTGKGSTTGRFTMPPDAGKRLVAVGDAVYVTLGADAPVSAIDAATGRTRRVFDETARADEILMSDGRLIVTINPESRSVFDLTDNSAPPPAPGKQIMAVDPDTGRVLWKRGPFTAIRATRTQDPYGRLELAAGDGHVFCLTSEAIHTLSAATGETVWRIDRPALAEGADRRLGFAGVYEFLLTVMVYHDGVVLLAQPEPNSPHSYHTVPGTLYAFDAGTGRQIWKHEYGAWGHCTPPDVFVVDGVVWTHVNADADFNVAPNGWIKVPDTSNIDYRIQGLDLKTGGLIKELPTRDLLNVGHHHRCYRNKITERFLMLSRRGVEFVDLESGENFQNHWVRSGCLLGNLPSNGLVYVTPHPCGCYMEAKLTGFNALAPARKTESGERKADPLSRLQRGPAYQKPSTLNPQPSTLSDWPTFRHDPQRTGATAMDVPTPLAVAWRTSIEAAPSAPVVAGGMLFVAAVDAHTVHAIDAQSGRPLWSYTAEARVESPPTVAAGLVIFGSADGRVVALRQADGQLAWRFDAAPEASRVMIRDQLESPWPVPGVLVEDGKCWFAAGRSSYLDGGIYVYALDAATGEVVSEKTFYNPDPATGKITPETSANSLPGLLNDVPGSDGNSVFIRQMNVSSPEESGGPHLFTTAGYLDPSWFNRTFWKYGPSQTSGLMVLGDDVTYGMEVYDSRSRETVFKPASGAYRLVCGGRRRAETWERSVPIRVTALVRAGGTIFAAGSPDVVDPADPHAAWEGRKGGVVAAFAASDGKPLAEIELPAPPVWDGLAAAEGSLFVALEDGQLLRLNSPSPGSP
jgi:outer membrane protein assembly factor BamB